MTHTTPVDSAEITSPLAGIVASIPVAQGATIAAGSIVCIIESMKLEHPVRAPGHGTVTAIDVTEGENVGEGTRLMTLEPAAELVSPPDGTREQPTDDRLAEVMDRRAMTRDDGRPEAVERMHSRGRLTAHEKVALLTDEESLLEYGTFTIAAQRSRRSLDELIERTPADGLITALATINRDDHPGERARTLVMAYDYTVLAGTQGVQNHKKMDRMLDLAGKESLPVVLIADGGGGRPGDTETTGKTGLDVPTFAKLAHLSGRVPLVAVVTDYCFAGNAILAGMCDVIIATEGAHIGAGGPAMIEGGGLGTYAPDEVGPVSVQGPNGVIDVLVDDDAAAVASARRYLSFFQGSVARWDEPDQTALRSAIPDSHRRAYEVRSAIEILADEGSVLELRRGFGRSIITALTRVEGRTVGVIATDPSHLGGAIDADAADKGARFIQLCDAFGLPIVSLIDTPGIMVGPDAERGATVRHASRLFVAGANARVPFLAVVTRRGFGLGAMAMAAGGFKETAFTVAWPTATMGPMGLEGAVQLGYRRELEAIDDPQRRAAQYDELVETAYDDGKALNAATWFDVDEVIDPADTRRWIAGHLHRSGGPEDRGSRYVDPW